MADNPAGTATDRPLRPLGGRSPPDNSSGCGLAGLVDLAGSVIGRGGPIAGFTGAGPLEQGEENTVRVQVPATGSFRTLMVTLVRTGRTRPAPHCGTILT
ncbi:hypothetical protein [Streptomyces graminilatus]|uniref:hypothetical protein n=1 Tax=Streptomyces graminilatus TaxID=1464070 RepID=UPI0012FF4A89|nr:hypothetical protein [Streptomyces graminilatus]